MLLGSNDRWQNGLGVTDVQTALIGLEQMCRVHITVTFSLEDEDGCLGPWLTGVMWTRMDTVGEVMRLVSAKLRCSDTDFRSLDTAVFRLLYMLDGQLAEKGLDTVSSQKAQLPPH